MDREHPDEAAPGTCWYCRRRPGANNSVALPFWSQQDDCVQVLVLPRCDDCFAFHHAQQYPFGLFVVGGAMAGAIPASLLPLPEPWRGVVIIGALLAGFVGGYVFGANRDARQAKRHGTRPLADYVQHPPYHALAADTAHWRQNYRPGIGDGSGARQETVNDLARYFTGIADEPAVIEALKQGCAAAGVPWRPA